MKAEAAHTLADTLAVLSGYIKMFFIEKRREMYFGKGMRADDVLVTRATWTKKI